MMHELLRDPADWDRYLAMLVAAEGREAELEARATLLIQSYLEQGVDHAEAVTRGLDEAERIELALRRREAQEPAAPARPREAPSAAPPSPRPPRPNPRWRPLATAGLALAAGLVIGVLVPRQTPVGPDRDPDWIWRGSAVGDAGSVRLWGEALDGEPLRLSVGQGVAPRLRLKPGRLQLLWVRPSGADGLSALAYTVDAEGRPRALGDEALDAEGRPRALGDEALACVADTGDEPDGPGEEATPSTIVAATFGEPDGLGEEAAPFTLLDGPAQVEPAPGAAALIVVVYPSDADPAEIAREAGDGTAPRSTSGSWRMLLLQLRDI